ncbi:YbaB/EbfC family nucleoid-associated protein [Streptomyces sp. NPDC047042]|uniref:YbaB/EbfC family nucleoid-associated protein n=1 Tax=Streptomyces sp. NPDC047042 TaxID=3154807 RepID=UPI0033D9C993
MSESMERKLAAAMAELTAVQEAVARAESELSQASATVRSRDRAVEVTVGPQGELTGLRFLDGKYRSMPGPQLATSILEAVQEGRAQMARKVMDTFAPLTERQGAGTGISGIDVDWERMFGSALDPEGGSGYGRPSRDRLRDEIHEDTDDTLPRGR